MSPPPWLREQILSNTHALHPTKSLSSLNIMTGRSELAPQFSILDANNTLVPQFMCYANVYCITEGEGGAGGKVEVLVHGGPVVGCAEEAMGKLAGVVEERIEKVFGVGGNRKAC